MRSSLPFSQQFERDEQRNFQVEQGPNKTAQQRWQGRVIIGQDALQLPEIGRPEARHGIPTRRCLRRNSIRSIPGRPKNEKSRTLKPCVPHPGAFPWVISFSPALPIEYNIGLRKPSGGFPSAMELSFRSATMPAKAGAAADVPPISTGWPLRMMAKLFDCAETSGYACKKEKIIDISVNG